MPACRLPLAVLFAFALLASSACSRQKGPELTAPEAYAQAQAGTLMLIDIRHPSEWRDTGVAAEAARIDMTQAQGEAGFVAKVNALMKDNKQHPIGLLSLAGNRGRNAQQVLQHAGYTRVYNISEGMAGNRAGPGWIARGLPLQACPDC